MSDKKVGRSPQPQDPEHAAGREIPHGTSDQADLSDVPEAIHGDKTELLARFREREERDRSREAGGEKSGPSEGD